MLHPPSESICPDNYSFDLCIFDIILICFIVITCTFPQTIVRVRLYHICFGILTTETCGIINITPQSRARVQGSRSGVATGLVSEWDMVQAFKRN